MNAKKITLLLAIITTGLSAGLMYAYSVSINNAFMQLSDIEYIHAVQAIDKVIQNPLFFLVFMGPFFLLPLAAYLYRKNSESSKAKMLIIASALYILGTFGATISVNLPLSDELDKVDTQAQSATELAKTRQDYAGPWNNWHTVRTVTAVAAFTLAVTAAVVPRPDKKETKA